MQSSVNLFPFFFFIVFSSPRYTSPLLLSSSPETKLFDLDSLPDSYLRFKGDSHRQHRAIILTKDRLPTNTPRSAGMILYRHPIVFLDPHSKKVPSFSTMFAFSIGNLDGDEESSGDGLAFLISPDDDLFGSPGYFGVVDSRHLSKNKFIAIEFDTKYDSMFLDPDDNHVGLDINSLFSVKLATSSSLSISLKSGLLIRSWIDYKGNEKRLEVFLGESYMKPKTPILKVDIDLSHYLQQNMFVGFSAATDRSMQFTRIEQWEFAILGFSPPPPPSTPESRITFPIPSGHRHNHLSRFAFGLTVGVCSVSFIVLFGWFGWKKLTGMIQRSEGTNNLEMHSIRSSRGISFQEILLSVLVEEVARRLNIKKVLDNETELNRVKTVKSIVPQSSSFEPVKPSILPLCNGLPQRTKDVTQSDDG